MDLHSVRRMMGHSNLSVTEKYLSLTTQDLARKHAAASPQAYVESLRHVEEPSVPKRRLRLALWGYVAQAAPIARGGRFSWYALTLPSPAG